MQSHTHDSDHMTSDHAVSDHTVLYMQNTQFSFIVVSDVYNMYISESDMSNMSNTWRTCIKTYKEHVKN